MFQTLLRKIAQELKRTLRSALNKDARRCDRSCKCQSSTCIDACVAIGCSGTGCNFCTRTRTCTRTRRSTRALPPPTLRSSRSCTCRIGGGRHSTRFHQGKLELSPTHGFSVSYSGWNCARQDCHPELRSRFRGSNPASGHAFGLTDTRPALSAGSRCAQLRQQRAASICR